MAIYSKNSDGEETGLNEWADASAFNREDAEDETVCHCNIKENAELIAAILEWDVKGAIHPYAIRYSTELVENIDKL